MGPQPPADGPLAGRLARELRDAFAQVAAAALPPEDKARWQRRLIAITNVSKRDATKAQASLERFCRDWRASAGP